MPVIWLACCAHPARIRDLRRLRGLSGCDYGSGERPRGLSRGGTDRDAAAPAAPDLCAALIKFDRFEWLVEKATELGVGAILRVDAVRSEKGLLEAARKRAERWRKIARENSQQSRRLARPKSAIPSRWPRRSRWRWRFPLFPGREATALPPWRRSCHRRSAPKLRFRCRCYRPGRRLDGRGTAAATPRSGGRRPLSDPRPAGRNGGDRRTPSSPIPGGHLS